VLALVATLLLLAACETLADESGITGVVTLGPISPVQREGESIERPYEATIVFKNGTGSVVAEVKSGPDGRFMVNLPPGTYLLEPVNGSPLPRAETQEVLVESDRLTDVVVSYDSGIR
jgi:hypothetical protein